MKTHMSHLVFMFQRIFGTDVSVSRFASTDVSMTKGKKFYPEKVLNLEVFFSQK
jgi:hypothetical protein